MATTDKKNSRQELVDSIMNAMKNRGEWQKTWENLAAPYNPITGTKYSGVNLIALSLDQNKLHTQDSRWCTFDQAVEAGYKIPKNTKAAHAHFYDLKVTLNKDDESHLIKAKSGRDYIAKVINFYRDHYPDKGVEIKKALANANGLQPTMNSDKAKLALFVGELNKATGANYKLYANTIIKSFPVFNFSQLENVPKLEIKIPTNTFEPIKRAEGILVASGAKIYHDNANRNYYIPEKHEIHLNPKESFKSPEAYYSTALHEVAHWTKGDGVSRHIQLDEKSGNGHDLAYAREELRAELASVFMASDLNLKLDIQNHSAYLGSYLKILNNDCNEFFSAVSDAQKISNHVLGLEKRLDLESESAKELQTKNPELYQKIVEFNVKYPKLETSQTKSDTTHDFKVGDTFIRKNDNNEYNQFEVIKMVNDTLQIKDESLGIIYEQKPQQFQETLDSYHAEKANFKIQDQIKEATTRESIAAQDHPNKIYLEKFFEEKNLPLTNFTVRSHGEPHIVESNVVISYLINGIDSTTQGKVKDILTDLDFKNADLNHFLEHCATGMIKQYEAIREIDALDNDFKKHEIEQELADEPKSQEVSSANSKVADNTINDDNDFSI